MQFPSLGREDPLEKGMAAHSSILVWRTPWTEEPGGLWGRKESDTTKYLSLTSHQCKSQNPYKDHEGYDLILPFPIFLTSPPTTLPLVHSNLATLASFLKLIKHVLTSCSGVVLINSSFTSLKTWFLSHLIKEIYPGTLLLLLSHFSRVQLYATPWTAVHQTPLSTGFSRQEYWSGLPFPSPSGTLGKPEYLPWISLCGREYVRSQS